MYSLYVLLETKISLCAKKNRQGNRENPKEKSFCRCTDRQISLTEKFNMLSVYCQKDGWLIEFFYITRFRNHMDPCL